MTRLRLACSYSKRVRGLLGKDIREDALLIAPCNDIHTMGMGYSIDVAFVNEAGVVVESYRDVEPGRRLRCRRACAVLERKHCGYAWYAEGEILSLATPAAVLPVTKPME